MLLIIEIMLTVTAWRRGWKALALLPVAICVGFGFVVGLGCGATGGDIDDAIGPCVAVELCCLVALIIMAVRGRKVAQVDALNASPAIPAHAGEDTKEGEGARQAA